MVSLVESPGIVRRIPGDNLGLNDEDWPVTTDPARSGPAPTFSFGSYTTIDHRGLHWNKWHRGPGVYNWTNLDECMQQLNGKPVTLVFAHCPLHLAQGYVDGGAGDTGDAATVGGYGSKGEGSFPTDLTQVRAAVIALLTRYNLPGQPRKIKGIQIGNEVSLATNPGNPFPAVSGQGAWWSTAANYVKFAAVAMQAILDTDPGCWVLSAAMYDRIGTPIWLDAYDPTSGKYGYECCTHIAIHPYKAWPNQGYGGPDVYDFPEGGMAWAQKLYADRGRPGLQCVITEYGLLSAPGARLTDFMANKSPEYRRRYAEDMVVNQAIRDCLQFHPFSRNNPNTLFGDMVNDTDGILLGLSRGYAATAGKEYIDGGYRVTDGRSWIKYADGTVYVVS